MVQYKCQIQRKGKFTEAEIIGFVGRSKKEPHTKQLLHIILTDIGSAQYKSAVGVKVTTPVVTRDAPSHDYSFKDDEDVYGDYDTEEAHEDVPETVVVDADEAASSMTKLCRCSRVCKMKHGFSGDVRVLG